MRNQEVSGLKGLLDKAKTSLEVWNLVREDETYWQTKDRKWVSEKDVVEFFKDKIVLDRKQVEDLYREWTCETIDGKFLEYSDLKLSKKYHKKLAELLEGQK